jgi:hypothetical protein
MTITHQTAARNAAATAVLDLIDAGAGPGKCQITKVAGDYSAPNILAEITCAAQAFGTPSDGQATQNALPLQDMIANNSGHAVQFRFVDSDINEVWRGTATVTGGGGDMTLPSTAIVAGYPVRLNVCVYRAPL